MTTTLERPEKAVGEPYKTPVTPEEAFQAIGRLRKEARDEIDRLIRFLDKTDDYVSRELEDAVDDNPHDEETDDNGEDNEEADRAEPSLGNVCVNEWSDQDRWAAGSRSDLEEEHDGAEPDEDGEPSLGAFEGHLDQEVSYTVSDAGVAFIHGAELDHAESGIGDQDGLDEQVPFRDWQGVGMV